MQNDIERCHNSVASSVADMMVSLSMARGMAVMSSSLTRWAMADRLGPSPRAGEEVTTQCQIDRAFRKRGVCGLHAHGLRRDDAH